MGSEALKAPGSTQMVLGNDLSKHTGKRVAVMGIIEAVDDEQSQLRVKVVGSDSVVLVVLQSPMEYQLRAGCPALVSGNLDDVSRISDAFCTSPSPDVEVEKPFDEELFKRALGTYSRFPGMFDASPPEHENQ